MQRKPLKPVAQKSRIKFVGQNRTCEIVICLKMLPQKKKLVNKTPSMFTAGLFVQRLHCNSGSI